MRRIFMALLLAGMVLSSCAPIKPLASGKNGNLQTASSEDTDMNAAMLEAQKTLPAFLTALRSPKATETCFAIKAKFVYGNTNNAEYIWVSKLSFNGKQFQGKLDNEPVFVKDLHQGDAVMVESKNVSDWMIVDNNQLLGGFTIHALRKRMTEADRARFDTAFGVNIPDQPTLP